MNGRKRHWFLYTLFFIVLLATILFYIIMMPQSSRTPYISPYPDGKNFAFTITDDAHNQTVEKIRPIYDFLYERGFRTTIAVYVKEPTRTNGMPDIALDSLNHDDRTELIRKNVNLKGDTLEQKEYLDYIQELNEKGFEIALHTVSGGNDLREATMAGYEEYKKIFGEYPKMNILHSNNLENVYWGTKAFNSAMTRWAFEKGIGKFYAKARFPFGGDDPESPYFWGDVLKEKTTYVRMWGTHKINTLKFNPHMPYHDPRKPYVNYWYSFSEGHTRRVFNKLLSDKNIEKLRKERGASIVYTHFSSGFLTRSEESGYMIDATAKTQLTKIAGHKDGWFVPASTLLDRLLLMKNIVISDTGGALTVSNLNASPVPGVTLMVNPESALYDHEGRSVRSNEEGEIVIGDLLPYSVLALYRNEEILSAGRPGLDWREHTRLVLSRILVWVTTVLDI